MLKNTNILKKSSDQTLKNNLKNLYNIKISKW